MKRTASAGPTVGKDEIAHVPQVDPPKPTRRIAVGTAPHLQDGSLILRLSFLPEFSHWEITFRPVPLGDGSWIQKERYDGFLINVFSEADQQLLLNTGMPTVNLSGLLAHPVLPTVTNQHEMIGQLAARHLLHDCAMEHLAYVGPRGDCVAWSQQRQTGFAHAAEAAGVAFSQKHYAPFHGSTMVSTPDSEFVSWLNQMPKPLGILAGDDWIALAILRTCGRLGFRVPEDVAVVGVNNDPLCALATPPISSVDRNLGVLLLEAARLLERLMNGQKPPRDPIRIPPDGIVKRRSTDVLAINDPAVAAAARLIREKSAELFDIESLAAEVGVHRRTLQRGFNRWLHCGPLEYIARMRVDRSKDLLTGPLKIGAIATECGFSSEKQFRSTFKRIAGVTPQEYRDNVIESARLEQ